MAIEKDFVPLSIRLRQSSRPAIDRRPTVSSIMLIASLRFTLRRILRNVHLRTSHQFFYVLLGNRFSTETYLFMYLLYFHVHSTDQTRLPPIFFILNFGIFFSLSSSHFIIIIQHLQAIPIHHVQSEASSKNCNPKFPPKSRWTSHS